MTTVGPARKLEPATVRLGPDLERREDEAGTRWVVRSFAVARQVLRAPDATQQAGFGASALGRSKMRPPILYAEGSQHRIQRRASARFFAPAVIEAYAPMIAELSDDLLTRLRPDRAVDLSRLSMRLAVQVTGRVVGLTHSSVRGMSARLGTFFSGPLAQDRSPAGLLRALRTTATLLAFHRLDVLPAIRARRRRPADDVISQLLQQGFSDLEILTEAVTYAAAGMATTREFVTVAAWHLLDQPDLRARYLAAERSEREAILHEILRLEPVVGELRRTTREPLTVQTDDGAVTIPAGAAIELQLRRTNADPEVVGADPDGLCPGRALPPAVPPVVLSFGDGHHRCPGGPLAILESDIFLTRLLALDLVADGPPRVHWNRVSQGYDLDRFRVRLRR